MTTMPDDVDPFIGERVIAIRNRFGVDGLRQAAQMISFELAIFADTQFSDQDQPAAAPESRTGPRSESRDVKTEQ
jgi:hypothetical protein